MPKEFVFWNLQRRSWLKTHIADNGDIKFFNFSTNLEISGADPWEEIKITKDQEYDFFLLPKEGGKEFGETAIHYRWKAGSKRLRTQEYHYSSKSFDPPEQLTSTTSLSSRLPKEEADTDFPEANSQTYLSEFTSAFEEIKKVETGKNTYSYSQKDFIALFKREKLSFTDAVPSRDGTFHMLAHGATSGETITAAPKNLFTDRLLQYILSQNGENLKSARIAIPLWIGDDPKAAHWVMLGIELRNPDAGKAKTFYDNYIAKQSAGTPLTSQEVTETLASIYEEASCYAYDSVGGNPYLKQQANQELATSLATQAKEAFGENITINEPYSPFIQPDIDTPSCPSHTDCGPVVVAHALHFLQHGNPVALTDPADLAERQAFVKDRRKKDFDLCGYGFQRRQLKETPAINILGTPLPKPPSRKPPADNKGGVLGPFDFTAPKCIEAIKKSSPQFNRIDSKNGKKEYRMSLGDSTITIERTKIHVTKITPESAKAVIQAYIAAAKVAFPPSHPYQNVPVKIDGEPTAKRLLAEAVTAAGLKIDVPKASTGKNGPDTPPSLPGMKI